MLTTTLVAVVSVLIAHASEGVDYDEYTDFATHEGIEVTSVFNIGIALTVNLQPLLRAENYT